ncbi:hypothetical protein [Streptomyces sp. BPTC-684]|uniref:SCO0607 family lipoprotein n=1 Tax=Streptomyces sp. BPTC-684 TaxID=3043734 RepID=UPI0024B1DC2D|nr:hypothetical protein [Streptomyces sp. BPTC-684]WHM41073.1 hypothetical protein QIY60_32250 [Streptomyces sp. BPTC-684]
MRTTIRPGAVLSGARRCRLVLVLAATAALSVTGCSLREASCGGGEYPVLAVGSTGGACVPNGQEPPTGYTRYPAGKVPEHVDDRWDIYWQSHTVDKDGKIIDAPED